MDEKLLDKIIPLSDEETEMEEIRMNWRKRDL